MAAADADHGTLLAVAAVPEALVEQFDCLHSVIRLGLSTRDLAVVFLSEAMYNLFVKRYFRVTLANPPLLPACLSGRARFMHLLEFDSRDLSLLRTSSVELHSELQRMEKERGVDFLSSFKVKNLEYVSLQRMIDVASELAQRGEANGLHCSIRFSSATLVPGQIIKRTIRPSDAEVERRARWGQHDYCFPQHPFFERAYQVNNICNGIVSLTKAEADFHASGECADWVYPRLKRMDALNTGNPATPPHYPQFSDKSFADSFCVPRALVRHCADAKFNIRPRAWLERSALGQLRDEDYESDQERTSSEDDDDDEL